MEKQGKLNPGVKATRKKNVIGLNTVSCPRLSPSHYLEFPQPEDLHQMASSNQLKDSSCRERLAEKVQDGGFTWPGLPDKAASEETNNWS